MIDRIRKFLLSPAGYALYDVMVNRPEEFSVHEYTIVHVPSKTTFCVANGGWFFDGKEHAKHSLGSLERHYRNLAPTTKAVLQGSVQIRHMCR